MRPASVTVMSWIWIVLGLICSCGGGRTLWRNALLAVRTDIMTPFAGFWVIQTIAALLLLAGLSGLLGGALLLKLRTAGRWLLQVANCAVIACIGVIVWSWLSAGVDWGVSWSSTRAFPLLGPLVVLTLVAVLIVAMAFKLGSREITAALQRAASSDLPTN